MVRKAAKHGHSHYTRVCARVLQATRDEEENADEEKRRRGEGREEERIQGGRCKRLSTPLSARAFSETHLLSFE